MKLKKIMIPFIILFIAFFIIVSVILQIPTASQLNLANVNDVTQTLSKNWYKPDFLPLPGREYEFDYTLLDENGNWLAATKEGLSRSLNSAVSNRDTITDIYVDGKLAGKMIIHNDFSEQLRLVKKRLLFTLCIFLLLFFVFCGGHIIWLNRAIFRPFQKLRSFAANVAAGNLDIPLQMDHENLFGAFTESFDLMREELACSHENEKRANQSKKELVASLSHDIKTPVASIKAVSELMLAGTKAEKDRERLEVINRKADQIDLLITNMFHSTLEELQELSVKLEEFPSIMLSNMLTGADYQNRINHQAVLIPECILLADPLRLSQVVDNIISNSYKYANTQIQASFLYQRHFLVLQLADSGPGAPEDEIPFLFEKFRRGSNTAGKAGAGLGLYLSHYLMKRMGGEIRCENRCGQESGFVVSLFLPMA